MTERESIQVGHKKYFTMSLVRHWNQVAQEVVNALSLEGFKAGLDEALNNLVLWKVSLHME